MQRSGGGRSLPPLLELMCDAGRAERPGGLELPHGPQVPPRRARRAVAHQSVVLLRLEDACEHGLGRKSLLGSVTVLAARCAQ